MLILVAILLSRYRHWPFIGGLLHQGDKPWPTSTKYLRPVPAN
jgi:hypothetical protein